MWSLIKPAHWMRRRFAPGCDGMWPRRNFRLARNGATGIQGVCPTWIVLRRMRRAFAFFQRIPIDDPHDPRA